MASGYQNIEPMLQAAPIYTPYAAQPYVGEETLYRPEYSADEEDQPLSKKFPNTKDLWNKSFGNQFKIKWSDDVKQLNSIKGRIYCLAAFLTTPFGFVFDTLSKVCEIAKETFDLLKDVSKFIGTHLRGEPDPLPNLSKRLIKFTDLTSSLVLSPFALIAQEVRLFVGILNPAWAFKSKTLRNEGHITNFGLKPSKLDQSYESYPYTKALEENVTSLLGPGPRSYFGDSDDEETGSESGQSTESETDQSYETHTTGQQPINYNWGAVDAVDDEEI